MEKLRNKNDIRHIETNNKMVGGSPSLSEITLDVSGLDSPIKRQGLTECIKKYDPTIGSKETCFRLKGTNRLKVKGWEQIYSRSPTYNVLTYDFSTLQWCESNTHYSRSCTSNFYLFPS